MLICVCFGKGESCIFDIYRLGGVERISIFVFFLGERVMRIEWFWYFLEEEFGYVLVVCIGSIWFLINIKREIFWS